MPEQVKKLMEMDPTLLKRKRISNYYIRLIRDGLGCYVNQESEPTDATEYEEYKKFIRHIFPDEEVKIIELMESSTLKITDRLTTE